MARICLSQCSARLALLVSGTRISTYGFTASEPGRSKWAGDQEEPKVIRPVLVDATCRGLELLAFHALPNV